MKMLKNQRVKKRCKSKKVTKIKRPKKKRMMTMMRNNKRSDPNTDDPIISYNPIILQYLRQTNYLL